MKTVVLKIDGMRCDGCAEAIKTLVEKESGVRKATVSFSDKEARILYDSQATAEDRLTAAIEKPGFRVVSQR
jgi:copper chaperone CopZ